MNSLEKIELFKNALLETDEIYDGPLGLIQGAVGAAAAGYGPDILGGLADSAEEFDQQLVDVAGFALWLRSDEAPAPDYDQIAKVPGVVVELLNETIGKPDPA